MNKATHGFKSHSGNYRFYGIQCLCGWITSECLTIAQVNYAFRKHLEENGVKPNEQLPRVRPRKNNAR